MRPSAGLGVLGSAASGVLEPRIRATRELAGKVVWSRGW